MPRPALREADDTRMTIGKEDHILAGEVDPPIQVEREKDLQAGRVDLQVVQAGRAEDHQEGLVEDLPAAG